MYFYILYIWWLMLTAKVKCFNYNVQMTYLDSYSAPIKLMTTLEYLQASAIDLSSARSRGWKQYKQSFFLFIIHLYMLWTPRKPDDIWLYCISFAFSSKHDIVKNFTFLEVYLTLKLHQKCMWLLNYTFLFLIKA